MGRKYLDAGTERREQLLSQDSYVRADSSRWGEQDRGRDADIPRKSDRELSGQPQYIPIRTWNSTSRSCRRRWRAARSIWKTCVSRRSSSPRLRVSRKRPVPNRIRQSQQKFAEAIEKYQKSLSLYRPSNEETIARIIHNLDIESKTNAFKKYRADGTALEQQRPVEALAALEKAATFRTYAIIEGEWILFTGQLQNLRSRVQAAKNLRARGEAQQKQGKITNAIASYEQSLKLVPDNALEEHVKLLRTQVTKEDDKKVNADRLWQEGTALFNQGRPADALTKFKESLSLWQDPAEQSMSRTWREGGPRLRPFGIKELNCNSRTGSRMR